MTSVALVHYAAPPIVGGVESIIGSHARLMTAAGHTVRILAGRGESTGPEVAFRLVELMDSRHPTIERIQAQLNGGSVPAEFDSLVGQLEGELREAFDGVDVVIAHNVCSLGLNLALTAALRRIVDGGAPRFVLWHHDLAATSPDYRPSLHEGRPWNLLAEAWPGVTNVVVSVGRQRELAKLTRLPAEAINVIPNGLDLDRTWRLDPRVVALRADLALQGVAPLLLVPARITPRKNIELALRVVAAIRAAGRPAGMIVTGPVDPHRSSKHDYLDRLLELRSSLGLDEVARFLATEPEGAPSDPVVDQLYRIADVLFLPSRDEGFGLPLLEAAANRVPIVCSDLAVLREIAGGDATYVDADEDPDAIARTILDRLDRDPAWRLLRRVHDDYSWARIYARLVEPLLAGVPG
ncbi:MAG TPA: glycosyltransferase [Candidatus Eisenbacteria bacterium]|nr:glycosyltransferase [Candidatus Eisenbacteria bacterium]